MKKFAAVIAVMALCSAPVMAAEQGGFLAHRQRKVRPEDSRGRTAA